MGPAGFNNIHYFPPPAQPDNKKIALRKKGMDAHPQLGISQHSQ